MSAGSLSRAVLPKKIKERYEERAEFIDWLVAKTSERSEVGELSRALAKNLYAYADLRRYSSACWKLHARKWGGVDVVLLLDAWEKWRRNE